jgi:cation transport ATPase
MLAGTDANTGRAIRDASTLGISTSAAEFVVAQKIPGTLGRRFRENQVQLCVGVGVLYNVVLLPVAVGLIYLAHGHPRLNPVWASLAMALSSLSAICSSLILRTGIPEIGFRAAREAEQRRG